MKCITPTDIPRSYFLDEVRDGFFVPSVIKKAWAGSLCAYKQLEQICDEQRIAVKTFEPQAVKALQDKHWPGNIRELRNVVERLIILAGPQITKEDVELYA